MDFFPPSASFCVGDTLLCSELRLASSQGFIYAVVSLPHSFLSCKLIVTSTVAQWSALSPHSEKIAGSIPARGTFEWGLHVHLVPLPESQRRARRGNLDPVAVCNVMATGSWCRRAFDPRQLGYDPERRVSRD